MQGQNNMKLLGVALLCLAVGIFIGTKLNNSNINNQGAQSISYKTNSKDTSLNTYLANSTPLDEKSSQTVLQIDAKSPDSWKNAFEIVSNQPPQVQLSPDYQIFINYSGCNDGRTYRRDLLGNLFVWNGTAWISSSLTNAQLRARGCSLSRSIE